MICFAFDTETTGLFDGGAWRSTKWEYTSKRIQDAPYLLDIGIVVLEYSTGKVLERCQMFVSGAPASHPKALETHGLTEVFLAEKGQSLENVMAKVAGLFARWEPKALLGYNVKFDLRVLLSCCVRAKLRGLHDAFAAAKHVDVMFLAMPLVGKRDPATFRPIPCRLVECLAFLFPDETFENLHTALQDIECTVKCYLEIRRRNPLHADVLGTKVNLSPQQRTIYSKYMLFSQNQDILVDACPGAGKTFLMINIIASLLERRERPSPRICLLTYNRSLADMYEVEFRKFGIDNLRSRSKVYHASTMDSLCYKLLGKSYGRTNYVEMFRNTDPADLKGEEVDKLRKCGYFFVDEYQDLKAEHLFLLQFLARTCPKARWFAAGDIRQTLYGESGAQPIGVREFRKWSFETIDTTFRCSGQVVAFCNQVFSRVDWKAEKNLVWESAKSVFKQPMLAHTTEVNLNVQYRYVPTFTMRATEQLLDFLVLRIEALRTNAKETISILSPTVHSEKAKRMFVDVELRLCQIYGAAFVFRHGSDQERRVSSKQHAVEIQSIHTSKGLTIDHVLLINYFECASNDNDVDWSFQPKSVQSCIKLFVAASRARKSLTLVDNHVNNTGCMPMGDVRLDPTGDTPCDRKMQTQEGEPPWVLSVHDAVRRHKSRPFECLVATPTRFCLTAKGYPGGSFDHPFATRKDREFTQHLGNEMMWSLYATTIETYLQQQLGVPLVFPCWINSLEERYWVKHGFVSPDVQQRYETLTGRSYTKEKPWVMVVPNHALECQGELYERYAKHADDEPTPSRSWTIARIVTYPDKSLLPCFDLKDQELGESTFWPELLGNVRNHFEEMESKGYARHWRHPVPSIDTRYGKATVTISGRPPVYWVSPCKSHIVLWLLSTVKDETLTTQEDFGGFYQLHLYNLMLQRKYAEAKVEGFIYFSLTGKLMRKDMTLQRPQELDDDSPREKKRLVAEQQV